MARGGRARARRGGVAAARAQARARGPPARGACPELVRRLEGHREGAADGRPVHGLPRTGEGRKRRAGQRHRRRHRGGLPQPDQLPRRLQRQHAQVPDAAADVRRHAPADAAGEERRPGDRGPAGGAAAVADPAAVVRAHPAARRAARVAVPPRGRVPQPLDRKVERHAIRGRRRARNLRRRGRNRGVQGGAGGDRRLPERPRALLAARRRHPARSPALGAARHRQDAAGARGRGAGGRALLLALRLRVHRDGRGRRCEPGARPVQAGEGERSGDHLHRRARRGWAGSRRRSARRGQRGA